MCERVDRRGHEDMRVLLLASAVILSAVCLQANITETGPSVVVRRLGTCKHRGVVHRCNVYFMCLLTGGVPVGGCGGGVLACCVPRDSATPTTPATPPVEIFGDRMCGLPSEKPQSRIVGGRDAEYAEFPWQVHIQLQRQQCGGVLLSNYFVMTAAHCVYLVPLHEIKVVLGGYDLHNPRDYGDTQIRGVSRVTLHEKFRYQSSRPHRYDVALLRLEPSVVFSPAVRPACLPSPSLNFTGRTGLIAGWGKTDPALHNRYGTRILQKASVPIVSNEECESWHHTRGIRVSVYPDMLCAGYEGGETDACVGDSGGPLIVRHRGRWTVAGIISAGFGCAQTRQPGIYHRITTTSRWIYSHIY